jgi:hypothetical protein
MQKIRRHLTTAALFAALVACDTAPIENDYVDTTAPQPGVQLPERDYVTGPGPIGDANTLLTGVVKNLFTGEPVSAATVTATGLVAPIETTGDNAGAYGVDIPIGSVFWAKTYKTGYKYTYDYVDLSQAAAAVEKNLYIVNGPALDAIATAHGKVLNPSCATIIATAKNAANTAQANVDGVTLAAGVSYEGPYYLNATNGADTAATYTSASGRMVWFNVCDTGALAITSGKTTLVTPAGTYYGPAKSAQLYPGGVSLVNLTVQQGTPPPPPPVEVIIDFPTEIMPIFAKYACASCHAEGYSAAATGLYFDENPETVYYTLSSRPTVVNIANPSASYLLTKPLLEDPANHPNASFEDTYNPDYVKILQWIESGAPYGVEPPPPVEVELDFAYDIYPIFTNRGCVGCHTGTASGGLDLSLDAATVQNFIINNALVDYTYNDRSALLRNPYCGPNYCAADQYPETHPTRVFFQTTDPDYIKMITWIGQLEPVDPVIVDPVFEPYTNVDFAAQRHRFAVNGCVRCHSKENYAANGNLMLVGTAQEVYDSLKDEVNNPNAVVEYDYAASNLMTKPNAYYVDVVHTGGKLVADLADPFARYFGGWIEEGANLIAPQPIDFATDVAPLFAVNSLNCVGCHNQADPDGGLALDGTPEEIFAAVSARVVATYPAQSPILTKSCGGYLYNGQDRCIFNRDIAHAGQRRNIAQYYAEFQILADWISEGAVLTP